MAKKLKKFNGEEVELRDIAKRMARTIGMGYAAPQWLVFCSYWLQKGFKVTVKETPNTHSKYVRVYGPGDVFYQVRFSNHKPNYRREIKGDCDFFVGITHTGVRTTAMAIKATQECFNAL